MYLMSFENIPQELKELDRWVCWRVEQRDGKPTKVPINPDEPEIKRAKSDNPSTWSDFGTSLDKMKKCNLPGIGFVFNGDGIIGIDLDDCRDPETGRITDIGIEIIKAFDSYTEISPSGKGVHIICRGQLPKGKKQTFIDQDGHKAHFGIYDTGRFFCMTGNTLDDAHLEIEERTEQLAEIHAKYIDKSSGKSKSMPAPVQPASCSASEDEVIERMMKSRKWRVIEPLLNGTWEGGKYASHSEADLALLNHLAYYSDRDPYIMESIFRKSGMYRGPEEKKNPKYLSITIEEALRGAQSTFSDNAGKKKKMDGQKPPDIDLGYDQMFGEPHEKNSTDFKDTTSDLGRSKIFSEKYYGILRWCTEMKIWLIWNGKNWQTDKLLKVIQMAKDTVEEMIVKVGQDIANATGEEQVKSAKQRFRDTVKGKSEKSIKSMVELAKSDMPITTQELDQDPFLLNCQNGVVDLRSGKLLPHNSEYYMTKIAGANYIPGAKFKKFGQFLKDITCNDDELSEYFQLICGMAAVGKVFYEGMCIFYGGGRNGKSTFLNCLSKVFGDYACAINPEMLMSQKDGRQMTGGVSVEGKRFVTTEEIEEGKRLSGAMLKKLASSGPVTERPLYQNERTFMPSHTLIMATNHLPKVGSTDTGTWRRIAVVPFRAVFEGKNEIKDYGTVLYNEDADAILTWVVEGAKKYIENGCNIIHPKVVTDATAQYRNAEDWLGNFLQECCEVGEYEESGGNLFEAYKTWCAQNNEGYVRRSRDFAAALEIQGFEKRRTMRGSMWMGVKLVDSMKVKTTSWSGSKNPNYRSGYSDDDLDEIARKMM
jgi:putative DNA primase/helicase